MVTPVVPVNARRDAVNETAQTLTEMAGMSQVRSAAGRWPVALVVDDCREDRERVCALLRGCGVRCVEASDAERALCLVQNRRPLFGVFGIGLPGMSGGELAWRIRELGLDMPLIAVSGQLDRWDVDDLSDLGFDQVFSKPLDRQQFIDSGLAALGSATYGASNTRKAV